MAESFLKNRIAAHSGSVKKGERTHPEHTPNEDRIQSGRKKVINGAENGVFFLTTFLYMNDTRYSIKSKAGHLKKNQR